MAVVRDVPTRSVYAAFAVISLLVAGAAAWLAASRPDLYRPYFGAVSPGWALGAIGVAGGVALFGLNRYSEFRVRRTTKRGGLLTAAALAVPFMISVSVADVARRFPEQLNVAVPWALLFYPVMGYLVELLHAVGLALLLPVATVTLRSWPREWRIWLCIAAVACLEAAFQSTASTADAALAVFVVAQLLLFGCVELWLFRRYDFVTMYVFRMSYYAYWHILWGSLRLSWLF